MKLHSSQLKDLLERLHAGSKASDGIQTVSVAFLVPDDDPDPDGGTKIIRARARPSKRMTFGWDIEFEESLE